MFKKKVSKKELKYEIIDKKKVSKKNKTSIILNISFSITILALMGVFAWMVTNASEAENIDYTGRLIVTDNNVDVKLFVLKDNEYVEQSQSSSQPLIQVATLAPGSTQKYRFDIYNNIDTVLSITKIVFSEIYGDVDLLKSVVQIRCTSPKLFIYKLADIVEYDAVNEHYYFDFINKLDIPANDMISIYFNIHIDEKATNEIQDTNLSINKIMFINP
ncbi:MAG: hypothetical protein K0R72_196 [Clostridia bacterium]|jgi:hypothetical protein|nr:hypothetical protein [Clostridia bacterium]